MSAPQKPSARMRLFGWNGHLGRMLDTWGRHQRWWWMGVVGFVVAWAAYDVGQLVARADVFGASQNIKGSITIVEAVDKSKQGAGGRLLIMSSQSARFIDTSGVSWEIPDFANTASKGQLKELKSNGVAVDGEFDIKIKPVRVTPGDMLLATASDLMLKIVFIAFYGLIFYFVAKHFRGGKERFNKISDQSVPDVKIEDVAGYDGVKRELLEVVDYLREPSKFDRVGARPPKGVLLYGPPGNGKTLLAKAVAGEAAASFFEQSAASFIQIYAGEGAKSVRKLFDEARKAAPSVIFIDEIDAIGSARSGGSHDERVQTLNAILTEMDGFQNNKGLVVVAATNRLDVLDAALIRPGRFDRKVWIGMPNTSDRLAILKTHARSIPVSSLVNWEMWATQTQGFSGADLSALINEGAIEAARANRAEVSSEDLEHARDRVWIGAKNYGQILSAKDRRIIAIHELGHAWMRLYVGGKIEKVSIAPRGQSLGVTVSMGVEEKFVHTKQDVHKELLVLMGGKAAEQVVFGHVTGGALDDMTRASAMAREGSLGFGSEKWGTYIPTVATNEDTQNEAAAWVNRAYQEAQDVLSLCVEQLNKACELLLEKDELTQADLLPFQAPPPATNT